MSPSISGPRSAAVGIAGPLTEQVFAFDYLRGSLLVVDGSGGLARATPFATALFGLPAAAVGRPLSDLVPAAVRADAEARSAGHWVGELAAADGTRLRSVWARLPGPGGSAWIVALAVPAAGATPLLERQRLAAVQVIGRAIAHDLNNALAPITLSASLLAEGASATIRPLVAGIAESAEHALKLVHALQRLTRDGDAASGPVLLRHLLEGLRKTTATEAAEPALDVDVGDESWAVRGDPAVLFQLCSNLWLGALEATPPGGLLRAAIEADDAAPGQRVWLRLAAEAPAGSGGADPGAVAPFELTPALLDQGAHLRLAAAAAVAASVGGRLWMARGAAPALVALELPMATAPAARSPR